MNFHALNYEQIINYQLYFYKAFDMHAHMYTPYDQLVD